MTGDAGQPARRLHARLAVLGEIATLAEGRVPPAVAARLEATLQRAEGRLDHGTAHTVVAVAGPTGSGKSSTFNALAGSELAATGVRRPTTATTQAAIFTTGATVSADVAGLLSWLDVRRHAVVDDPALDGLVLLDLPDHDSTETSHRHEVDRLARVVDVFVWLVDPQKYADAALHRDYLRRFADHAEVTIVALNQIDTIAPEHRSATLDDLARIVAADGLAVARAGLVAKVTGADEGVRIMAVSARTGEGVDALRREIAARVSARRAAVDRIDADIDWIADDLGRALGDHTPSSVPDRAVRALGQALAHAAGVDAVADAVADAHRRRGVHAAGWPPTRWLARLRPDPLRRLGLDHRSDRADGRTASEAPDGVVPRTSLPAPSPVATAAVSTAIRRIHDDVSSGLTDTSRQRLAAVATSHRDDLDDALDRAIGTTPLPTQRPRWWDVAGTLQRVLAAVMAAGLLWLLAIFVVAWLQLPDLPSVDLGGLPMPTVLALGGGGLGLLLAAVARRATAVGARRRAALARSRLVGAATDVGRALVIAPLDAELRTMTRLQGLTSRLRR